MSILEVKHLSHGFGERTIFEDVSFRLLKGEHIGLVGANGEGKSTFMSIVTGHLQPDEGKVEWSKYVTAGYLDQHTVLEAGMTVRDVLRTAFDELFTTEARINDIYMSMADEDADMDALMEEVGELQDRLESRDFYTLDTKIDEVARALGVMDFGMESDVTERVLLHVIWLCHVRKNWIRWTVLSFRLKNQNHPLNSKNHVHQVVLFSKHKIWKLVTTVH